MEKAKNTFVVPADIPWDDVGSWDSLERSFDKNSEGNVVLGEAIAIDAQGCVVVNESQYKLAMLGVSDLVVVVAAEGVLVCHKDRAQDVRQVVAALDKKLAKA